jgi:hypothetical protein
LVGFAIVAAVGYCVLEFGEEHEPITLGNVLLCVACGVLVTWMYGGMGWALKQLFLPFKGKRP